METIVLKTKKQKRKKRQKIIFYLSIAAISLAFVICFKPTYQYYQVNKDNKKTVIGYTDDGNLLNKAMINIIKQAKSENKQIADSYFSAYINKKRVIVFRFVYENKKQKILSTLEDKIDLIIAAYELNIENTTYYLPYSHASYSIAQKIGKKDLLKGTYVNQQLITSIEDIKEIYNL